MDEFRQKRLLRRGEVEELTALRRSALYQKIAEGVFPAPVKIGKRSVRWRYQDILAWIESLETG